MSSLTPLKAGKARTARMLLTAFGPEVTGPLQDPDVLEVMLNPDGSVWLDRLSTAAD